MSIAETVAAVARGEIDPVDLVRVSLQRVEAFDDLLNITAATFEAEAFEQLREGAASGAPLTGIPVAIKDTFALPWHAPRNGTGVAFAKPGRGESDIYRRLRDSGGIVLYAANMHQFSFGTTGHVSADGPCRNPWDPKRCAGGSSGGSAIAVAIGSVPLAIGTDAVGSVRVPASYCGIVGFKPTWGSLGFGGASSFSSLTSIGTFTRDSADCLHTAEALLGRTLSGGRVPQRVGLPEAMWQNLDPEIERVCREALAELEAAGCELVDVELQLDADQLGPFAGSALALDRRGYLDETWRREVLPHLHPAIQRALERSEALSNDDAADVLDFRTHLIREVDRVLASVDVLAWPTVPAPPPLVKRPRAELPLGEVSSDLAVMRLVALANLSGIPAVSVPCGFDDRGMPVGLGLHARWSCEEALLALASRFEATTGRRHLRRPYPEHFSEEQIS